MIKVLIFWLDYLRPKVFMILVFNPSLRCECVELFMHVMFKHKAYHDVEFYVIAHTQR